MSTSQSSSTDIHASLPPAVASEVSQYQRHGYLFGQKIAKSYSPFLHNFIYEHLGLNWGQVRLDSADIPMFLQLAHHPDFYGAAVTMPNKVAIIPHLDELTEECRDVGACNTLFLRTDPDTGRRLLCGANTDTVGIRDSFTRNVKSPETVYHNRPAMVIGGGGAARSAVYALRKWLKPTTIYLVNRDAAEVEDIVQDCVARGYGDDLLHVETVEQAKSLDAPGAIVACIPDFTPQTDLEKQARAVTEVFLEKGAGKGAILEMCYNPTPFTQLGALAEANEWQVILGTEAMIYQGLEQDRYWTGKSVEEMPTREVQAAIAAKIAEVAEQPSKL